MNPYFHPMKKPDGGEWPALVERCPECRPKVGEDMIRFLPSRKVECGNDVMGIPPFTASLRECFLLTDDATKDDFAEQWLAREVEPEIACLLARERAIAWLQRQRRDSQNSDATDHPASDDGILAALEFGVSDETYARLCHEVLDAKENT